MSSDFDYEYVIAQLNLTLELAHALKHAVGGVRGYVYEARQIAELLDATTPHVRRLQNALERADGSAKQALSYLASFRAIGQPLTAPSRIDLSEMLKAVADDVATLARERNVQMLFDVSSVPIVTDAELLHAVLSELMRASLQVLTGAGKIHVVISADRKTVNLEIIVSPAMDSSSYVVRGVMEHFLTAAMKRLGGEYKADYNHSHQTLSMRLSLAAPEQQV
jgi:signal transduction histidine kinase